MIFVDDHRFEVQAHTVFFELDGHGISGAAALDDRNRELAAGEEARRLAIHGDQVWLSQSTQSTVGLHGANQLHGVATHEEDVHRTGKGTLHQAIGDLAERTWTTARDESANTGTALI